MPPLVNLASHPQPPWFLNLISPSVSLLNWHPLFQTPLMCSALNISCTVTFFLPQSLFSCLSGHQVLLPCHSLPGSLQCLLCAATQHCYFPGSVPLNGSSQLLSHDQPNLKSYWYYLLINLNEINSENSKTAWEKASTGFSQSTVQILEELLSVPQTDRIFWRQNKWESAISLLFHSKRVFSTNGDERTGSYLAEVTETKLNYTKTPAPGFLIHRRRGICQSWFICHLACISRTCL